MFVWVIAVGQMISKSHANPYAYKTALNLLRLGSANFYRYFLR